MATAKKTTKSKAKVVKPEDRELTPKQEAFVLEFALTGNKSQAYAAAHDTTKTGGALASIAYKAFNKPHLKKRYGELRKQCEADYVVSKESLAREFDKAVTLAEKVGAPAALASAVTGKAKLYGQMTDKVQQEITGANGAPLVPAEVIIRVVQVVKKP